MATIPTENISFSILRTKYNESGQGHIPNPGPIKLSDFIGAEFTAGDPVPATNISINNYFKGKSFVSASWSWTERVSSGTKTWVDVASNADGTKLVACVFNTGGVWTSTDSGASWTPRTLTGINGVYKVASSSSGEKLAAAISGKNIWTSTNSGADWTEHLNTGLPQNWFGIASDALGDQLVLADANNLGSVFTYDTSNNVLTEMGNPPLPPETFFYSVASSANGEKLAAVAYEGDIWTYSGTSPGDSWTERTVGGGNLWWVRITSSADGTKLAAVVEQGNIWTSVDSGATWTQVSYSGWDTTQNWSGIASNGEGTKLAACVNGGNIWTSIDSGATWTEDTSVGSTQQWGAIASSDNGNKLVASVIDGNIWTGQFGT